MTTFSEVNARLRSEGIDGYLSYMESGLYFFMRAPAGARILSEKTPDQWVEIASNIIANMTTTTKRPTDAERIRELALIIGSHRQTKEARTAVDALLALCDALRAADSDGEG